MCPGTLPIIVRREAAPATTGDRTYFRTPVLAAARCVENARDAATAPIPHAPARPRDARDSPAGDRGAGRRQALRQDAVRGRPRGPLPDGRRVAVPPRQRQPGAAPAVLPPAQPV